MNSFLVSNSTFFLQSLAKYSINTPLRLAHFMGQLAHESQNFTKLFEGGNRNYFNQYEGSTTLGNTQKGDGYKFRGRGLIQLTGRWNYNQYRLYSGIDVISNPDLLATPKIAIDAACWYFSVFKKLNSVADADDVRTISVKINGINKKTGQPNNLPDRIAKVAYFKSVDILTELKKKSNFVIPGQLLISTGFGILLYWGLKHNKII